MGSREQRYKYAGFLFFVVFIIVIALTNQGKAKLEEEWAEDPDSSKPLLSALGFGVVLFASEAMGFVINSIAMFLFWNLNWNRNSPLEVLSKPHFGGYSRDARRNSTKNPKDLIIEEYEKTPDTNRETLGDFTDEMTDAKLKKAVDSVTGDNETNSTPANGQ